MTDPDHDQAPTAEAADRENLATVLRAGIAVYTAGEHHAAHDAWEDAWLDLERDTPDERLLHGLIQFTAAVYHARRANWSGAVGLAESGAVYLEDLPEDYRGVDVAGARGALTRLRADPERVERGSVPDLTYRGETVRPERLDLGAAAVAADVVAEEYGYDESVVADAARFAREAADPDSTRYATFLRDFVGDAEHRATVFRRLERVVERDRREERDVRGLFGERDGEE